MYQDEGRCAGVEEVEGEMGRCGGGVETLVTSTGPYTRVATYIDVPRPYPRTRDRLSGTPTNTHDTRVIRKNPKFK